MWIKIKLPGKKNKTKCSPKCKFLTLSVTYDSCELFGEQVRKGIPFDNRIRCQQCLEAEISKND